MLSSLKKNKILDLFPPPDFLKLPYVGVDLSDQSIKYIELIKKGPSVRVGLFGGRVFPEGLIVDGEIKNRQDVISILKKFKKDTGFEFIHLSLPEEKAFLFKTLVPDLPDEEIRSNLSFQLEKNVPISLPNALYDYDVIDKKGEGGKLEVVVTVFPKAFVENYSNILREAGLVPLSFEIEAQAIARAVVGLEDAEASMIVDIGRKRTGLSIVDGGVVQFTSTIDIGGDVMSKVVKETMRVDDKGAVKIKNEIGFSRNPKNRELFVNLSTAVSALRDEINKHYNYWTSRVEKEKVNPIKKIILCGGNSNLYGLPEHLSSNLGVETERASVWGNLFSLEDYIPPITYRESLEFSTAVGLALTDIL